MNNYFRVELVNGKHGYGNSSYLALIDAVGKVKADIICDFTVNSSQFGNKFLVYSRNGNKVMEIEKLY